MNDDRADDAEDKVSTTRLPAVNADKSRGDDDDVNTTPVNAVSSEDVINTSPLKAVKGPITEPNPAIEEKTDLFDERHGLPDDQTGLIDRPDLSSDGTGAPGDMTGLMDRPDRSTEGTSAPDDRTGLMSAEDPKTQERRRPTGFDAPTNQRKKLPHGETQAAYVLPVDERDDDTNPGGVSDNAIVRRVVVPDPPTRQGAALKPLPDPPTSPRVAFTPPPHNEAPTAKPQPALVRPNPVAVAAPPAARAQPPVPAQPPSRAQAPRATASRSDASRARSRGSARMIKWTAAVRKVSGEFTPIRTTPKSFVAAAIPAFAWGIATLLIAASFWLTPAEALLVSLVGVVPAFIASAFVSRDPDRIFHVKDAAQLGRPVAAAAAIVIALGFLWNFGFVRAPARSLAGTEPAIFRAVLADSDDGIATRECTRLAAILPNGDAAKALAENLAKRPGVLRACLQASSDEAVRLFASGPGDRWIRALDTDAVTGPVACTVADPITQLARAPGEIESRLMRCIAQSSVEGATCCAQALAKMAKRPMAWVTKKAKSRPFVPNEAEVAASMGLAFDSNSVPEERRVLVEKAGFAKAEPRRMMFVLACSALEQGNLVGEELAASVPPGCDVPKKQIATDAESWTRACRRASDALVRRRSDPSETLCFAVRSMARGDAFEAANKAMSDAIKRTRLLTL